MILFKSNQTKFLIVIGLIIVVASLWFIPGPERRGATVKIIPNGEQVQQGFEWQADVIIESNVAVNALDIAVMFPDDEVTVKETSLDSSRFETKIFEPMLEEQKHEIYFVQATLEPFTGQDGLAGTITFKAKKPAKPRIEIAPGSKIIAHDGNGTNVFQTSLSRSVGVWLVDLVRGKR